MPRHASRPAKKQAGPINPTDLENMIYPFVSRSLTQSIDQRIHQEVRAAAPWKYWVFRVSTYLERAAFAIGVLSFLAYVVGYSAARAAGHLDSPAFAEVVDVLAIVVVASVSASVTGALFQSIIFRDLEFLAEQAVSRISVGR